MDLCIPAKWRQIHQSMELELRALGCCFPAIVELFRKRTSIWKFSYWCTYMISRWFQESLEKNHIIGKMTYQTLLVRVSFWSVHGRVPKIASPLTCNHDPTSRRRSSNIGRITPSAVGPIFINKFPALSKHVCKNTSQSNLEGMVAARKAVISPPEYLPPQLTVVTSVSINPRVVRKSERRAFRRKAQASLSIVMAFSHLRVCKTPFFSPTPSASSINLQIVLASLAVLLPGLYLSWQFTKSPCLHPTPRPHRSFTTTVWRTGLSL